MISINKKNNIKNILWNTIGVGLNSFISLFLLIIITRINGIEETGIFSYLYTLSLLLFSISSYGGRIYQVSDLKKEFSNDAYYSSRIITSLVGIIIVFSFALINEFNLNRLIILLILSLIKIIDSFSDVIYGVFQKENELYKVGISYTLRFVFSILGFFLTDYYTKNILLATISYLIINFLVFLFYDKKLIKNKIKFEIFNFNKYIKLLKTTKYLFFLNFLIILVINIPRYMVDRLLSDKFQGYFGIVIMIPTAILLFGQFIIQPTITSLTKLYNEKKYEKYEAINRKNYLYIIIITILSMVGAYFIGPLLLKIIFNKDFSLYRLLIVISILGGLFSVFTNMISVNLTIMRITKIQFVLYFITFIFGIIISYYFTILFKFNGVFISYLLITFIQFILFFITNSIKLNKKRRNHEKDITRFS